MYSYVYIKKLLFIDNNIYRIELKQISTFEYKIFCFGKCKIQ